MNEHPRRSARIDAAAAQASFPRFNASNVFLFDPDKPHEDPNDLLNRVHDGKMMDPAAMNHNCPFCSRTMAWDLFIAHGEACFRKWRKVVRGQRLFAGATPAKSVTIMGEVAAATGGSDEVQ